MRKKTNPVFIHGLELAGRFYREAVKPILDAGFPGLRYSAALIGPGSEVLGFDDEMSTDHHWGPRLMLFLPPGDWRSRKDDIHALLGERLPVSFAGYPTNFTAPDPNDNGAMFMRPVRTGPVNHRVEAFTVDGFFENYLNIDVNLELSAGDWLTLPQQKLRSLAAGRVFHDDLGLETVRAHSHGGRAKSSSPARIRFWPECTTISN
ncbi:MAG: hypothetical protein JXD23_07895 [Spirochaetales bacterium]|nr:hypothetical protein [Spirochaetales bacterium]